MGPRVGRTMSDYELDHLKQMANQIAANFGFHEDQVARTADHLTRFWAPSMRDKLAALAERPDSGLEPAVIEAVRLLGQ